MSAITVEEINAPHSEPDAEVAEVLSEKPEHWVSAYEWTKPEPTLNEDWRAWVRNYVDRLLADPTWHAENERRQTEKAARREQLAKTRSTKID